MANQCERKVIQANSRLIKELKIKIIFNETNYEIND